MSSFQSSILYVTGEKMAKQKIPTSTSANSDTDSSSDTYKCLFRSLWNYSAALGITPAEAARKVNINRKTLSRMMDGTPVEYRHYEAFADLFEISPDLLIWTHDLQISDGSPAMKLALHIEQLIDRGAIPNDPDPLTNQPIDVYAFICRMGDRTIDEYSLREIREAIVVLRDCLFRVIERPVAVSTGHQVMMGRIEIAPTFLEEVLDDIETRRSNSNKAFDQLCSQYANGDPRKNIAYIQRELPLRMAAYRDAVEKDEKSVDENGNYLLNRSTMKKVVEQDCFVRRLPFTTQSSDNSFRGFYRRSERMIDLAANRHPEKWAAEWPAYRRANTEDLEDFEMAWETEPPNWKKMVHALDHTLHSIYELLEEFDGLYPKFNRTLVLTED